VGDDPLGNTQLLISICVVFYTEYVDDSGGKPVLKLPDGVKPKMNIAHIAWARGKVRRMLCCRAINMCWRQ
jgi:hypothetical protein